MNIQWYPGHMTKTRRMILENISLVDVVIEILDARIPYSSKNPDMDELAKNKFRIIVLNKMDLADEQTTKLWEAYFEAKGFCVVLVNAQSGKGVNDVTQAAKRLMQDKIEAQKKRGRLFVPVRAMVCGIPNAGKSTFINKYVGRATAKTGDRPGVTRGKQWIKIKKDLELLDTPGILWPKFEDPRVGICLAITGAVNDDILDLQELSTELCSMLLKMDLRILQTRYKIEIADTDDGASILLKIGEARGFKMKGGEADLSRTAKILLDEFRGGKLGRVSLERPEEFLDMEDRNEISKRNS